MGGDWGEVGGEQVVFIPSSYLCGFEIRRHVVFIAQWRASASEARPIIAVYSRSRDICIYIRLSARALHKTVHTFRKSYHVGIVQCPSEQWLLFGSPL